MRGDFVGRVATVAVSLMVEPGIMHLEARQCGNRHPAGFHAVLGSMPSVLALVSRSRAGG